MLNWDAARQSVRPGSSRCPSATASPESSSPTAASPCPSTTTDPAGETIELYAREVVASDKAGQDLPWLVYLQGGPGLRGRTVSSAGRPGSAGPSKEYRVLLLDQRGTGRSTPANRQTLPLRGGPAEQADYLAHFRADSIVRDCEAIRRQGAPAARPGPSSARASAASAPSPTSPSPPRGSPRPSSPAACPPSTPTPTTSTGPPTRASSARSPRTTPATRRTSSAPAGSPTTCSTHEVDPAGRLPPHRRGVPVPRHRCSARGDGSHRLHYLLEDAFVRTRAGPALSDAFQEEVQGLLSFAGHPLYALVHEAIYGQDEPAHRLVGRAGPRRVPAVRRGQDARGRRAAAVHRRDRPPLDVRLRPRAAPAARDAPNCSPPAPTGRPCTTPPASPPTRCRSPRPSTTTTCTSTRAHSLRHRPRRSAACAPGSPTSSSTTASVRRPPRPGPAARPGPRRGVTRAAGGCRCRRV